MNLLIQVQHRLIHIIINTYNVYRNVLRYNASSWKLYMMELDWLKGSHNGLASEWNCPFMLLICGDMFWGYCYEKCIIIRLNLVYMYNLCIYFQFHQQTTILTLPAVMMGPVLTPMPTVLTPSVCAVWDISSRTPSVVSQYMALNETLKYSWIPSTWSKVIPWSHYLLTPCSLHWHFLWGLFLTLAMASPPTRACQPICFQVA